ncbi:MAG: phosphoribosylformimino-5-aminoimidazole carboxamide ribotide isomerase [Eubacterium sp.]|nr:phosphoribosylformimino-5-aminoimidazole carboxamide ribotide isomerase [Eubacterium sp.]
MQLRPCIDIHNGKVKQIVGQSLRDAGSSAQANFVSEHSADYFALMYKEDNIKGGHIIMLNKAGSEYYEKTKAQALFALSAYPMGMQIGGGINADNAEEFLKAGASHVIVTSYVFSDGKINMKNLEKLKSAVGKEHIVLDLSCKKKGENYYVVTDRWQNFTDTVLSTKTLDSLTDYADEFLIHAADVEGKKAGIDKDVLKILSTYDKKPVTYAGGVSSLDDIETIKNFGSGNVNVTVGSALDIFGGSLSYKELVRKYR